MGVLILLASVLTGYFLVKKFLNFKQPQVSVCGGFLVGCLLSGTCLYLLDLVCVALTADYFAGTVIYLAATGWLAYSNRRFILEAAAQDFAALQKDRIGLAVLVFFSAFSLFLCWHSFSVTTRGDLSVYNGAWSDIVYHHAYVRSIVHGENVPVQYPYFANEPIHYHFLFNYYAGKIAQLGLHSVTAYNAVSALGMICLLMLIFEFGRIFFKSALTGFLGASFLVFHGSLSVFPWIGQNFNADFLTKIIFKDGWLTGARFEDWGLFNLNVFVNQRHLSFTLALVVLLVIFVYQYAQMSESESSPETIQANWFARFGISFETLKPMFLWIIIIGAMPFWNVLAAVTGIMFLVAFAVIHYKNRRAAVGFLLTAAAAALIVYPQLQLYKSGASVLTEYPKFHFGYGAESSLWEFALYYVTVWESKFF